jgi:hypothetical protein
MFARIVMSAGRQTRSRLAVLRRGATIPFREIVPDVLEFVKASLGR